MPELRPSTVSRQLTAGARVEPHRHAEHQIVYAGRGVLAVTTGAGSWHIPSTRAIWVPAGVVHEHRAYGVTDLHTVGLPTNVDPVGRPGPAVIAVGPLHRELIITCTREPAGRSDRGDRLRALVVDELRTADQLTSISPRPATLAWSRSAGSCARTRPIRAGSPSWAPRSG